MRDAPPSVLSASATTALGTVVSGLLAAVYVALGARWLGPEDYGSVGAAVSLANLLFLVLNPLEAGLVLKVTAYLRAGDTLGLGAFLRDAARALLLWAVTLTLVWTAACGLLARYGVLETPGPAQWLGLFFFSMMVLCLPRAVLRGRERFTPVATNLVVENLLRLIIGLTLIWLGAGPAGMVAGYALANAGAVVHAMLSARRGLPAATPIESTWRPWSRAALVLPFQSLSLPLLGIHLYAGVVMNVDVLAAKHFLDAQAAGLYAGAASVARLVAMGANPVLLVLFSRLALLGSGEPDAARTIRVTALWGGGVLTATLLVPLIMGRHLLLFFLGDAYADADGILLWLWAAVSVLTAQSFFADAMVATSRVRGSWLLAPTAASIVACVWIFSSSGIAIARALLVAAATLGSLTYYLLWRFRLRVQPVNLT